jgi:hypothetical protein
MKTDTHTPGPWQIQLWNDSSRPSRRDTPVITTGKDAIGELFNLWDEDGEDREAERLANARLIAAAPDLLAALKDAEALLFLLGKEHEETGGIDYNADFIAGTRNELLLSIAKAEGRDS